MRTKNLTTFPFGTRVTSTKPPKPEMVVVVRGRFEMVDGGVARVRDTEEATAFLSQGPLTADRFADDDDARAGALLYASDFADLKPKAEVLLTGRCRTPDGKAATSCDVSLRLGSFEKTIRVFGPRQWTEQEDRLVPGRPKSFTEMPLTYGRAFGGPQSRSNPVGLGREGLDMPNLEDPEHLLESFDDRPKPACFAPLNPAWPARAEKLGRAWGDGYDKRAPYYAADFDFAHFNAAPADQQLPAFPKGDEPLVVTNVIAGTPKMSTRLPALRVRAFVTDLRSAFREVPLVLDTVLVDGDAGDVVLTWRGRTEVQDPELEDVTAMLVVSEPLAEPAMPASHYEPVLSAYAADPLEIDKILPKPYADLYRAQQNKQSTTPGAVKLLEDASPEGSSAARAAADGDLEGKVEAALDDAAGDVPPVPIPVDPRLRLGLDSKQVTDTLALLKQADPERAAELEKQLSDERLVQLDPNYRPPNRPPPKDSPIERGADLRGRDFTGRDLSGKDLSGCDLEGAIFKQAILKGTQLVGANLTGALFFKADLTGAFLTGARLARTNFGKARLTGARLEETLLDTAFFGQAEAEDAVFDRAKGRWAFFHEANLKGASFCGVELERADFESARLDKARFDEAKLSSCLFHQVLAPGAAFVGAQLERTSFEKAELAGAAFDKIRADLAVFIDAGLERASFARAKLTRSELSRARANRAAFDKADLSASRFFKARLQSATFQAAKLLGTDFSRSNLTETRFDDANLFDAKLVGATTTRASFEGASLEKVVMQA